MNLKTASNEPEWSTLVKSGALDLAYLRYAQVPNFSSSWLDIIVRLLSLLVPKNLICALVKPFVSFLLNVTSPDTSYTSIDLSEVFLLFWKKPDSVGMLLLGGCIQLSINARKTPVRALIWLAHWLVFQGAYHKAIWLFRKLNLLTLNEPKLRLEFNSLLGNYFYVRGKLSRANWYFHQTHVAAKTSGNQFAIMFNLGLWVLTAAHTGNKKDLDRITEHFDSLLPDKPDERYGLRLLAVSAYIHFKNGNPDIGNRFWDSATVIFERSGSSLDRSIYHIFKSLIDILSGDQKLALEDLDRAEVELAQFGSYVYFKELIHGLRLKFLDKTPSANKLQVRFRHHRGIQNFLYFEKYSNTPNGQISSDSWYRRYFEVVLPLFEAADSVELSELIITLKDQTLAHKIDFKVESIGDSVQKVCRVSLNPTGSQFDFNIIHRNEVCVITLTSPFLPWRNNDVFIALKSMITSLQLSSFQEFNLRRESERKSQVEISNLARQVAHDIRSPLSALSMLIAGTSGLDSDRGDLMKRSVKRINLIANDLLAKSRYPSNIKNNLLHVAEEPEAYAVEKIVNEVIEDKKLEFGSREDVKLFAIHAQNSIFLPKHIPSDTLHTIISNIINNSYEAISTHGEIVVSTELQSAAILIQIKDSGGGMNNEILTRINNGESESFNKKFGNGIGLSHARLCILKWGGRFEVASLLSVGTTVRFWLPVITL